MKSFSDSCRLVGPLELVVEAGGESDVGVRVLHQPFAIIGRDPRADVPLDHRLVSRRHAYLQVVEGFAFWIDLESRLGTMAGDRARKFGWLTSDEPMRVGPYALRMGGSGRTPEAGVAPPSAIPLVSRSYGATPWPDVGLEFLNGPSRSAVWPMNRVVSLIGSAAGCKFRLADPSVSPFHCSLVRTRAGVWVVDLLGGGVEVNNATARYAFLSDGDVLAVGRYRIRIRSRDVPDESDSTAGRTTTAAAGLGIEGHSLALVRPPDPAAPSIRREGDQVSAVVPTSVLPAETERGAATDPMSVLVPLMNQFGLMQQQMMDQFQSAMGMLVGMFGSLQREQMDLIRQELDQLREVTREVQELKAELASRGEGRTAEAAASAPPPASAFQAPAPPRPSAAGATEGGRPEPTRKDVAPEVPPPAATPAPTTEEAARGPARPGARSRPRPERPAPTANEADVMLWLNQRINTLQVERETRWQKILKLLPGSS